MALFSTVARDLQAHLDVFCSWCDHNFVVVSVPKTKAMVYGGGLPHVFLVNGGPLEVVRQYKYVGVTVCSDKRDIFADHYETKASKGRNVARAVFCAESFVGTIPVRTGRTLYLARVDPHLTGGSPVCPQTAGYWFSRHRRFSLHRNRVHAYRPSASHSRTAVPPISASPAPSPVCRGSHA